MLLIVGMCVRDGICNAVHRYAKASNQCMRHYDGNKGSSYINCCDVNNSFGWVMSLNLPKFNFEWVVDISQLNEVFIKNYDGKKCIRLYS